jgi:hypothetical protein
MRKLAPFPVLVVVGAAMAGSVLYMPSNPDDALLRSQVSDYTGEACDYLDPRYSVPELDQLIPYDMVFTWANYAYADPWLTGDLLADYVDRDGVVLLGQWCLSSLRGRIMDTSGPYLPCTGDSYQYGGSTYAGDGTTAYLDGVGSYFTSYRDDVTVRDGFSSDGTYTDGYPFLAYGHGRVFYAAGVLGSYGSGDHARLIANLSYVPEPGTLALHALGSFVAIRRRQNETIKPTENA